MSSCRMSWVALALPLVLTAACPAPPSDADSEDLTWTLGDSPYLFREDITVPAGATLTIEPGVRVEMAYGYNIFVEGELLARGTEDRPIVFTAESRDGLVDPWGSLHFSDSSVDASFEAVDDYVGGSIIEHCIFEHASKAIRLSGASPYIRKSTFRDNESEAALDIAGGGAIYMEAGARPRIRDCTFENNTAHVFTYGGAIYATKSDPIIQDNVFRTNTGSYGGALTTDWVAAPIVGNLFEGNETVSEGGAVSLVSSVSAFINNRVTGNHADIDGGGVHVCTTCFPHANPLVVDNVITGNTSDSSDPAEGAGGFGAAYLRVFEANDIHGNLRGGVASDFRWAHALDEGYPDWVANPSLGGNWWGSTTSATVAHAVFDGTDDPSFGRVDLEPLLDRPVAEPRPRALITTRRIHYDDALLPVTAFLTLYNPGEARAFEAVIEYQLDAGAAQGHTSPLEIPGASVVAGRHLFELPANSVFFAELEPQATQIPAGTEGGHWSVQLFDGGSQEALAEPCRARFIYEP